MMQDGFMISLHCSALRHVGFTDNQANAILLCISDMIYDKNVGALVALNFKDEEDEESEE